MTLLQDIVQQKLNWAKENPSLCFFPYNTLDVRIPDNSSQKDKIRASCCCNLEFPLKVQNVISDPFEHLQKQMGQGLLPADCVKCSIEEKTGGVSERIRDILARDLDELEAFAKLRTVKTFELRVLISNICNLACRSCEPYSSSTYAKITNNNDSLHLNIDVTEIDHYWVLITNTVKEKLDSVEHFYLHFMGGEPLLHKGNKKLIDWLIENQYNSRVIIRITTSINVPIDEKLLINFDKFKGVDYIFSLDGVYENYHYVRWPGKFDKTLNNLNQIVDYKSKSNSPTHFNYILSPVFSLNNIFYLDDYLDFWYSWQKSKNVSMFFLNTNLLYRTRHLDIQALPIVYRVDVEKILDKALEHPILGEYSDKMQHLYNFLRSAKEELNKWEQNLDLWDQFLTHTAEFDIRTNTNFDYYNSRLYNILLEEHKNLYKQKLNNVNKNQKIQLFSIK